MHLFTVEYPFYSEVYGGKTIPEAIFGSYVRRAEGALNHMLRQKNKELSEESVGLLICELCDALYREDGRRGISRESIDGYDVSYYDVTTSEVRQAVRRHLGDSGALYRGRRL